MANFINRTRYYWSSLTKLPFGKYYACSNCGARDGNVIDRKYLITSLARCESCRILFRRPTTTIAEANRFYSDDTYVTDHSNPANFARNAHTSEGLRAVKDFGDYIRVIRSLELQPDHRILDYGCSWGYGTAQIKAAGFNIVGYEISRANRQFAAGALRLPVVADFDSFANDRRNRGSLDVFFSSHVLEHLVSVEKVIAQAMDLLKPGGTLLAFVPNGSEDFRLADPRKWRRRWGEVHPLFLNEQYFLQRFPDNPILIGSSPLPEQSLATFRRGSGRITAPLNGPELACLVRKPA